MKKFPVIPLLLFALVLLTACEPPQTVRVYPIGAEIQEDYSFQEGSWWVYERQSDLVVDSVSLESVVDDAFTVMNSRNSVENWPYIRMNMHGSFRDEDFYYGISHGQLHLNGGDEEESRWEGEILAKTGAFQGQWLGSSGTRFTELAAVFAQLDVGGVPYFGVQMVEQRDWNLPTQDNLVNIYYLAPGVGLIRVDRNLQSGTSETWNLVRHSVSQ